jgi:hypothetical protein
VRDLVCRRTLLLGIAVVCEAALVAELDTRQLTQITPPAPKSEVILL